MKAEGQFRFLECGEVVGKYGKADLTGKRLLEDANRYLRTFEGKW